MAGAVWNIAAMRDEDESSDPCDALTTTIANMCIGETPYADKLFIKIAELFPPSKKTPDNRSDKKKLSDILNTLKEAPCLFMYSFIIHLTTYDDAGDELENIIAEFKPTPTPSTLNAILYTLCGIGGMNAQDAKNVVISYANLFGAHPTKCSCKTFTRPALVDVSSNGEIDMKNILP